MDGPLYLDLELLVNGGMDFFLLVLTGRLTQVRALSLKRLLGGVFVGEIPVVLAITPYPALLEMSKFLTPFLMILVAFPPVSWRKYWQQLIAFWVLSAGIGGLIYAVWGWVTFSGASHPLLQLGFETLWILPAAAGVWWVMQHAWMKWQFKKALLHYTVYDLRIKFTPEGNAVTVKALVDTGNSLRDPLTGVPVILLEESAAASEIPEEWKAWQRGLQQESPGSPWALLWQQDPQLIKKLVFIPYQAVGRRSWLVGIRPQEVTCFAGGKAQKVQATVALVNQTLSPDGSYQALLHPEIIQRGGL